MDPPPQPLAEPCMQTRLFLPRMLHQGHALGQNPRQASHRCSRRSAKNLYGAALCKEHDSQLLTIKPTLRHSHKYLTVHFAPTIHRGMADEVACYNAGSVSAYQAARGQCDPIAADSS